MIKLNDFDYTQGEYELGGKVLKYRSANSPEFIRAGAVFDLLIKKCLDEEIPITDKVTVGAVSHNLPNQQYFELNAMLAKSAVIEWPFDDIDIDAELLENQVLCSVLINKAQAKAADFASKKKS